MDGLVFHCFVFFVCYFIILLVFLFGLRLKVAHSSSVSCCVEFGWFVSFVFGHLGARLCSASGFGFDCCSPEASKVIIKGDYRNRTTNKDLEIC